MNKTLKNTQRRFKQGRITHKKMVTLVKKELRKVVEASQKEYDAVANDLTNLLPEATHDEVVVEEHIHGESCNH